MSTFRTLHESFVMRPSTKVAALLILAVLFWATGMPTLLNYSNAATITFVSDTLTDSSPGSVSDHLIVGTTTAALDAGDTITISFASTTQWSFDGGLTDADIDVTGSDISAVTCGGGSNDVSVSTTSDAVTDEIVFTVCAGDSIPAAAFLSFNIQNGSITNPTNTGSYVINLVTTDTDTGPTDLDTGETRVVILDDVTVTASVDTIFEFTVNTVGAGQPIVSNVVTDIASTPTALDFGVLVPGASTTMAHELNVESNAINGFTVTVEEDQDLTSSTGATIDRFVEGSGTAVPTAWAAPVPQLGQANTYGHFGITSDDTDIFPTADRWVGDFDAPREVYNETTPVSANGSLNGVALVAYNIEINSLQEAGDDYTNTLMYIATPTF